MKRAIIGLSAVVLLAGVLTLSGTAWSQNNEKATATAAAAPSTLPHKVGLIDMAHVFKHYEKFEALREDLKGEIGKSEVQAKEMQQELVDLQTNLKKLTEGTPAYAKLEQDIVRKAADFENFRRTASRDFLKKESKIYLQVYTETSDAVKKYADYYKYTLIMRFSRDPLDTENPQALLQGMNRPVVFNRDEDDITDSVLKYLNERYNRTTATPAATKPSATRPAGATAPKVN